MRIDLNNGYVKLTEGWLDTRTGKEYSEVICSYENEKYFKKIEED